MDLDAALQDSGLVPWEEAASAASNKALSYYRRGLGFRANMFMMRLESDPDNFKKQFGIDPSIDIEAWLPELAVECADIDYELEVLQARFAREMERALGVLIERGPERSPLLPLDEVRHPGVFTTIHVEEGGWFVAYRFTYDEFPALRHILQAKEPLVARRLKRMREFAGRVQ